jgi:hypothetical protein
MSSRSRQALAFGCGLTLVGGLVVANQPGSASAAPERAAAAGSTLALPKAPPAGKSWIQGVLTDQAGKALDNVNVEVWAADVVSTEPAASNLTYAGVPADAAHQHGVFRVEVPAGAPYIVTLSTVGGVDDGDAFRAQKVSGGRPIMARTARTARAAAPGRVIKLGTIALARQGHVRSKITATLVKPKKGKVGVAAKGAAQRYRVKVHVTSPHVTDVTGKVLLRVDRKRITDQITSREHGTSVILLPKNLKDGKHTVLAQYKGSNTVARSKAKPLKLKVS